MGVREPLDKRPWIFSHFLALLNHSGDYKAFGDTGFL
jgi:hypothetical protein